MPSILQLARRSTWRDGFDAAAIHFVQQTANIVSRHVDLQCPGGIGITDHVCEVRSILQQHAPIGHALAEVFHLAVDSQLNPAQHLQLKAGGCHDDIGLQLAAGFQRDATFRKGLDVIRDD